MNRGKTAQNLRGTWELWVDVRNPDIQLFYGIYEVVQNVGVLDLHCNRPSEIKTLYFIAPANKYCIKKEPRAVRAATGKIPHNIWSIGEKKGMVLAILMQIQQVHCQWCENAINVWKKMNSKLLLSLKYCVCNELVSDVLYRRNVG